MTVQTLAIIVLLVSFFVMIFLRFPIAYAVGLSSVLCMMVQGQALTDVCRLMVKGISSFSLMAVPFFITMGVLMGSGGISEKLIALACEKTLENTGKVSFAYADKILAAWKSKGISTVREAIDDSAAVKRSIPQNRSAQTGRDSSIDMDKIRAMLHRQLDG